MKVVDAPLEGGLNRTVTVEVRLPLYLVAACHAEKSLGSPDDIIRMALRDFLQAKGRTWWFSRLRASIVARQLEQR